MLVFFPERGLIIKEGSGQGEDIQDWRDSTSTSTGGGISKIRYDLMYLNVYSDENGGLIYSTTSFEIEYRFCKF